MFHGCITSSDMKYLLRHVQWRLFRRSKEVNFYCFREKSPASVTKVPAIAGSRLLFWTLPRVQNSSRHFEKFEKSPASVTKVPAIAGSRLLFWTLVIMAWAKRIYILIIKVNKLFSFFASRCFLKEIENMYCVFLSSYRNTRESLGELEKAVETLACGSCSHSISHSPKLPLVFLFKK